MLSVLDEFFERELERIFSSLFWKMNKWILKAKIFKGWHPYIQGPLMGPLFLNFLAHSKGKAQSLISLGPNSDMSSNDMSCDDVSPSDTSSGATSSFSIKWHVWYNRYYISILSSSLMKCHQMTCHHLPRHHTCHVITWHVINDDKLKPVLIPVV